MVTFDAVRRTHGYAGGAQTQEVALNPVAQTVCLIDGVQSSREVVASLLTELVDAAERLNEVLGGG